MPIIFNGQAYNSVDDMPPDARQAYDQAMGMLADKNKDGMPDAQERPAAPHAEYDGVRPPGQSMARRCRGWKTCRRKRGSRSSRPCSPWMPTERRA